MSERDWNARYESGHTPWDKGFGAPPLEELLENSEFVRCAGDAWILVPGCGRGHDVRLLAGARPLQPVLGIDIAPRAIAEAKAAVRHENEHFELADWFGFDAGEREVSLIWEHTCYCAIPPSRREEYACKIRQLLSPGAYFFGVFFLDTGSAEGPPWSSTEEELLERFAEGFECVYHTLPTRQFESRHGREVVMGWRRL